MTENPPPTSYCLFAAKLDSENFHRRYHDTAYGFPLEDDNELFGRLILEINQAGLSWSTILAKEENFRKAYHKFQIKKVAGYGEEERARLLADAGIIRNPLKVKAAIHNAGVILTLQKEFGSFKNWLDHHHPRSQEEWSSMFKKTFYFTGGQIVNEFLMSTGYLAGAHHPSCPIYEEILQTEPPWTAVKQ